MVGGMLESRIAIGCSFNLVLSMKGFDVLDLDTLLLLATEPVQRATTSTILPFNLGMSLAPE